MAAPSIAQTGEAQARREQTRARALLVASIGVTAVLYTVPALHRAAYPLVLLSTLVHEMGHGIAALLSGGRFESLAMWSDASGVARAGGSGSRLASAFVSAGGLVGPALAAALCFVLGRGPRRARAFLAVLCAGLLLALVLVVRNVFGWVFVGGLVVALLLVTLRASARTAQLVLLFIGAQLALSVFSRGDYLFTAVAQMASGPMPSDVAQMAEALYLPYWFWGLVCGGFSLLVLVFGLVAFWRPVRP